MTTRFPIVSRQNRTSERMPAIYYLTGIGMIVALAASSSLRDGAILLLPIPLLIVTILAILLGYPIVRTFSSAGAQK